MKILAVGLALAVLTAGVAQAGTAKVFQGEAVAIGKGSARVVVAAGADGLPRSVAIVMGEAALEGLPADLPPGLPEIEYRLPMPAGGPATGYREVTVNWNPHGHPPAGIYDKPHFDFHFYLIDGGEREGVTFRGADAAAATAALDKALVPAGYVVPPDTAVEHMGVHGVDPRGAEFHKHPFERAFIYGYYRNRLTFVEPMVSLAYLQTKPDVTLPVTAPAAYSLPGYYPARYRVGFDAKTRHYTIALTGLKEWQGPGPTVAKR